MAEQASGVTWRDSYAEALARFGAETLRSQRRRADPTTGLARAAVAAPRLVEACEAADRATAQDLEGDRGRA